MTRDESAIIVVETVARYLGYVDRNAHSFAEFFVEKFVKQADVDGGFWRRDYHNNITVEQLSGDELTELGDVYLKWNEISSFTCEHVESGRTYPYRSTSTIEIADKAHAKLILNAFRYEVRAGGKRAFSFDDHRSAIAAHDFKSSDYTREGLSVSASDEQIRIEVQKPLLAESNILDIVVDEESFIAVHDTTFELTFNEPTKRLTFRMKLPDNFRIFHFGCSGRKFGTKRSDKVNMSNSTGNRARLDIDEWCMPGIITVLAWTIEDPAKELKPVKSVDPLPATDGPSGD